MKHGLIKNINNEIPTEEYLSKNKRFLYSWDII